MYFQWKPYVSVAERRKKAERAAARFKRKGQALSPVIAARGAIARTFWGKAWCDNLERYSDFSNRLPRGRTYLRNGSVIDLTVAAGEISAQVMGSDLYRIKVNIAPVPKAHWHALGSDCAGSIDSLVELLQGRMSKGVMERICRPGTGLFPSPKEITFSCSCPDWAAMCKHVAAVFYGVGARLDAQPDLLFTLRRVDAKELVARAGAGLPLSKKGPAAGKVLDASMLADVFGIEMEEMAVAQVSVPAARGKAASRSKKPVVGKKKAAKKKAAKKKTAKVAVNIGMRNAPAAKRKRRVEQKQKT